MNRNVAQLCLLTAYNPPTDNTPQTHPHPLPHSLSSHATGHTSTLLLPEPLLLRLGANSTLNEEHTNPSVGVRA